MIFSRATKISTRHEMGVPRVKGRACAVISTPTQSITKQSGNADANQE
jgi:hypothetical protein